MQRKKVKQRNGAKRQSEETSEKQSREMEPRDKTKKRVKSKVEKWSQETKRRNE